MTGKRFGYFNFFFRTIRARLLTSYVLLVIIPVGIITGNSISAGLQNGRRQAFEQFESVAALKVAWLKIWTQSLQTDLLGLVKEQWYQQAVAMLIENTAPSFSQENRQYLLDTLVQVMELTNRYEELFIISPDGYIALSTDPVKTGEFRGMQPYFIAGMKRAGVHVQSIGFSSASEKLNNLIVVQPIKDMHGKTVGVICGQANFGIVNAIMGQRTGLGETGETYLVGSNHVLMTMARFPGFTPGMTSIHGRGVITAFANKSNILGLYEDYRGVPIIGAYHWIAGLNLVLAAKQDRSEAFSPIYTALWRNAVIAALAVLAASIAALFISRGISLPLASLSATATGIADGDLELMAIAYRQDEIGSLTRSFNRMTTRLRDRIDNERLIADMSRKFISLPFAEIDPAIEQAIAEIGMALGVDRTYVASFSIDEKNVTKTLNWCYRNIPPRDDKHIAELAEKLPWFAAKLKNRQIVDVTILANLPAEASAEKEHWQREGIQSLICVPMVYGNSLHGFIGFDAVTKRRVWGKDDIHLLQIVGEIIFNAMAKDRAETKMRNLQNLLKNIINSMPSMLVGVNTYGEVTQWNHEAQNSTGITAENAQGRLLSEVFPQLADEMAKVHEAIEDREPKKDQKITIDLDGKSKISDITVYPLVGSGVEGAVIRIDDVTERVRIEEMMIQSEKMLSVGGLAAGMAHEINNPLAVIMQSAQVVIQRTSANLPANHDAAKKCGISLADIESYMNHRQIDKLLSSIQDAGERAAQIVENMLSFSRKSDYSFEHQILSDILDNTIELASSDYNLKKQHDFRLIKIVREYAADLPPIPCEKTKIQQVFFNLLKNAAEAMAGQAASREEPQITLRLLNAENMIRIEVEDNGPGMAENIRKRIFEPFYTTKGVGEGTGLGLSVSYFIVRENHGGTMTVESAPQKGAKFIINLPVNRRV